MVSQVWEPAAHLSNHARSRLRKSVARGKKYGREMTLNGGLKGTKKAESSFSQTRLCVWLNIVVDEVRCGLFVLLMVAHGRLEWVPPPQ